MKAIGALLGAVVLSCATSVSAARMEATLSHGLSYATSSTFGRAGESAVRNGGVGVSAHFALRFRHPVMPFVELGSSSVYASDDTVDLGSLGGRALAYNRSSASWILGGPEVPLGPVRLWGGIGAYQLSVRSTVLGVTIDTREWTMGYGLGATVFVVERAWFRAGVSGRVLLMSEVETALFHAGWVLGAVL